MSSHRVADAEAQVTQLHGARLIVPCTKLFNVADVSCRRFAAES